MSIFPRRGRPAALVNDTPYERTGKTSRTAQLRDTGYSC